ncbi:pyridoxamine 5'-phosphate oxidase [Thiotrichales bacterium 19S11-10]|nr:pyridoxamine 5'-phosphate oxidase [Thiotrichales bacterium 19S11-10]
MANLNDWRINYPNRAFFQTKLGTCPFDAFAQWLNQAKKTKITEPNAFSLSTVDENNRPDSRMLLLKDFNHTGFIFYTNYNSQKSLQLEQNPSASMLFWWPDLHQQIRIRGPVIKVSSDISDTYFATRDKESQISAWASKQSQVIKNYNELMESFQKAQDQFKSEKNIPRPAHWGGYSLQPLLIEFWQGRHSRLHERICFQRDDFKSTDWQINHLAP